MKKRTILIIFLLIIIGGFAFYKYFLGGELSVPTPGKNDQLAWQILKSGTYPNYHVDSGEVTLVDGSASAKINGKSTEVFISNTRAYGDLNGDKNLDGAIALITEKEDKSTFVDILAVLGNGKSIEKSISVPLDENIYSGTISTNDNQIIVEYIIPEKEYHTPAKVINKTFALDGDKLNLVSEKEENVSINKLVEDNKPKTISFKNNRYKDEGTLNSGKIQPYSFDGVKGDSVDIKVDSENDDVILSVFANKSEKIILSVTDQKKQVSGVVPETGNYTILVVPTSGNSTDYKFNFSIKPQEKSANVPNKPATTPPDSGGKKVLYFTFDDGPWGSTQDVLNILNEYSAKATFFVIGRQVESNMPTIENIIKSGSTIANHTWDHASMSGMSREKFSSEVTSSENVLAGKITNCLRPPGGAMDSFSRAYAQELGYKIVMWDIDTKDWSMPGTDYIVSEVMNNAAPGKIVLMHDGGGDRSQTIAALKQVLPQLKGSGYEFLPYCTQIR